MKRFKKDTTITDFVYSKDLSFDEIGMLNSLLIKSDEELSNCNLYSISNDSKRDIIVTFNSLKHKRYIIYNELDETYYIYATPQG